MLAETVPQATTGEDAAYLYERSAFRKSRGFSQRFRIHEVGLAASGTIEGGFGKAGIGAAQRGFGRVET
jgi:hypothetical protein